MKKTILTLALFAALSVNSFAQQKSPEDRAKKSTEMMATNLSLSDEQKAKIYDATLERVKATDVLKAAAGEGNKPDMEQMKAVNKKYNDVLKATLTEEQKTKLAEIKAQGGQKMKPKAN